jgi:hypothetical protein
MLPPRPIRRLVLAPLVIVIAAGFIVLSPFLGLLALVSGLLARPRAGHMRSLRLVGFALIWLVAETAVLITLCRDGALVIFPEGGNWTPRRWRRGIRRLESQGRSDLAERARDMPNLLPPRPGGTLAAVSACPDADVIFVAHVGLDDIVTLGEVWKRIPIDQVVRARWWRVPYDQVPRDAAHEDQVQWLYAWWEQIDAWITENKPALTAEPVAELPCRPPVRGGCARQSRLVTMWRVTDGPGRPVPGT